MNAFKLAPLYRRSVGFDHFADMFENMLGNEETQSTYPPYNIEKQSDDRYQISMALAGFTKDNIDIQLIKNELTVIGKVNADSKSKSESTFLYKGIAQRSFQQRFRLADNVEVVGADMEHGLLHIQLRRVIPEAAKPRSIPIGQNTNRDQSAKAIEENQQTGSVDIA